MATTSYDSSSMKQFQNQGFIAGTRQHVSLIHNLNLDEHAYTRDLISRVTYRTGFHSNVTVEKLQQLQTNTMDGNQT